MYDVAFCSEGLGSKTVKSYSYVISSLEEILRILEEDRGLLSSKGEIFWCLEVF